MGGGKTKHEAKVKSHSSVSGACEETRPRVRRRMRRQLDDPVQTDL
jgi:hypothetical protein